MKRNVIRLTENQLHSVIKESVKRIINEMETNEDPEYQEYLESIEKEQDYMQSRLLSDRIQYENLSTEEMVKEVAEVVSKNPLPFIKYCERNNISLDSNTLVEIANCY